MVSVVYVVECRWGKYYIGRCAVEGLRRRLEQHRNCSGSAFTSIYPALRIVKSSVSNDPLDEDRTVLEWMRTHGIANVRGGTWSNVNLTEAQITSLNTQLDHAAGLCLRCRGVGHFATNCTARPAEEEAVEEDADVCFRCGRSGHWASNCYARTHADGTPLLGTPSRPRNFPATDEDDDDIICFRCGRRGHMANACYARTHANGRRMFE